VEAWLPAIEAIGDRHDCRPVRAQRFERGENPVFDLDGRWVLKLVPPIWATIARRESACLAHLAGTGVPVPAWRGSGELDDWHYVVMERIPGRSLEDQWPDLTENERLAAAQALGAALASLHRLPVGTFRPDGVQWAERVRSWIAAWPRRRDVAKLAPDLQSSGVAYLEACGLDALSAPPVLLHGDLAPENAFAAGQGDRWHVRAMVDFGNAMVGPAWFDLTAPSVIMGRGSRPLVQALLTGYGHPSLSAADRRELMAHTMIHPMGDLSECLALHPDLPKARSWDEVAAVFWPE
jgi:hygromycin-B 7''-O-kinase